MRRTAAPSWMVGVGSRLCELLGIEVPIVLAPFGPWEQVDLAAAVCEAGGLGSVGTAVRSVDELRTQWDRLRAATDRPFAINHTGRPFNAAAFEATLAFGPAAISFHMAIPADQRVAQLFRGRIAHAGIDNQWPDHPPPEPHRQPSVA